MQKEELAGLMDLRVDYAFKLFFATSGTRHLVSLLNAVFADKGIPRAVTALTVNNPSLEKEHSQDKLSTLDIFAKLSDGSRACIEMHLYGLNEFKYKSVRTWARAYGRELSSGQAYDAAMPAICVAFLDGGIADSCGNPVRKVHSLFQIMERDGHQLLLDDCEIHFINMRAFVDETLTSWSHSSGNAPPGAAMDKRLMQWLALITNETIPDKGMVTKILSGSEEMAMAVETLARLGEDLDARLAYQQRKDEIFFFNREIDSYKTQAEEAGRKAEEAGRKAEEADRKIESAVKLLHKSGISIQEIESTLNITRDDIEKILQPL
jgi:predicted transposase/invertase (TIGR01784 family)